MAKIAKAKDESKAKIKPKVEDWAEELNEQQRLFVLYYCTDEFCFLNGTLSYRKAYPKCKSDEAAATGASKLLRIAKVKKSARSLLKLTRELDDELAAYKILKTYEHLAFYNPADIITDTGELLKPLSELGPLAICVEQIQTFYAKDGKPFTVVKLANRHKALTVLMKYLSLVKPEINMEAMMPVAMISDKTSIAEWQTETKTS